MHRHTAGILRRRRARIDHLPRSLREYRRVHIRTCDCFTYTCTRTPEFAIWTIYADVIPFVEAPKLTRIRYTRRAMSVLATRCPPRGSGDVIRILDSRVTRSLVRDSYTSSFSQPRRYGFIRLTSRGSFRFIVRIEFSWKELIDPARLMTPRFATSISIKASLVISAKKII